MTERSPIPLKQAGFYILLAIADGASHGSAIRARVLELSSGQLTLWPTTLYGTIRELLEDGLIAHTEASGGLDRDARRREVRLTAEGRSVLREETERLESLVAHAKSVGDAR